MYGVVRTFDPPPKWLVANQDNLPTFRPNCEMKTQQLSDPNQSSQPSFGGDTGSVTIHLYETGSVASRFSGKTHQADERKEAVGCPARQVRERRRNRSCWETLPARVGDASTMLPFEISPALNEATAEGHPRCCHRGGETLSASVHETDLSLARPD